MADPAERVSLGPSQVQVCRLGFGTAPLGGLLRETHEDDARAAVQAALDAGLCYFDTAPQYGGGLAEQRLGRGLLGARRDSITVSTKVGKLVDLRQEKSETSSTAFVGAPAHEIIYDYSYDGTMRSVEASLQRLGLSRIDILLIHDVNRKYHGDGVMDRLEEALRGACPALLKMRSEGVIGAFGAATNELDVLSRFVREVELDCIMLPQRFTLLDQSAAKTLLPLCQAKGVSVLLAAPFDSGILATGMSSAATYNYQPVTPIIAAQVERLQRLCHDHEIPLPAAALQFGFRHPAVASVVTGMRSASELEANSRLLGIEIPREFWQSLELEVHSAGHIA